jgi:hypothetical protein
MYRTQRFKHVTRLSLLMLFAALVVATTASATVSVFMPGKLCGDVSGATWRFNGHGGTRYNVSARSTGSCAVAMKSVSALTKQKPRAGALGPHTLAGPSGFRCMGAAIKLAHAGFCVGSNGAGFFWAPRLKS